jgi:glycosyltransferase involved in cell wall biosynthesis
VKELLEQCIVSIFSASKELKVEVIVVDNNSLMEA